MGFMTPPLKLAVAGLGNNISALVQGVFYYRNLLQSSKPDALPGISHQTIGPYGAADIEFVAAFDVNSRKVGTDLAEAFFSPPNSFPRLEVAVPSLGVPALAAPLLDGVPAHLHDNSAPIDSQTSLSEESIVGHLRESRANVEGVGWGGRPVTIDLKLRVQDSSTAAGPSSLRQNDLEFVWTPRSSNFHNVL